MTILIAALIFGLAVIILTAMSIIRTRSNENSSKILTVLKLLILIEALVFVGVFIFVILRTMAM